MNIIHCLKEEDGKTYVVKKDNGIEIEKISIEKYSNNTTGPLVSEMLRCDDEAGGNSGALQQENACRNNSDINKKPTDFNNRNRHTNTEKIGGNECKTYYYRGYKIIVIENKYKIYDLQNILVGESDNYRDATICIDSDINDKLSKGDNSEMQP